MITQKLVFSNKNKHSGTSTREIVIKQLFRIFKHSKQPPIISHGRKPSAPPFFPAHIPTRILSARFQLEAACFVIHMHHTTAPGLGFVRFSNEMKNILHQRQALLLRQHNTYPLQLGSAFGVYVCWHLASEGSTALPPSSSLHWGKNKEHNSTAEG